MTRQTPRMEPHEMIELHRKRFRQVLKVGVRSACVAVAVWLVAAVVMGFYHDWGTGDGDYTTMPVGQFLERATGLGSQPVPVVVQFTVTHSDTPILLIQDAWRDPMTRPWLRVRLMYHDGMLDLQVPYEAVQWRVAASGMTPTAVFTFRTGGDDVEVIEEPRGYGFWRWAKLQGPERYVVTDHEVKWVLGGYTFGFRVFDLGRGLGSLVLTVPDDPVWTKFRNI